MGWCTVNGRGEECSAMDCDRLEGDWNPRPVGGCLVLSLIEDPSARLVVQTLLYPPILDVRDQILRRTPLGDVIVRDFERHYDEAVAILRSDPDLFSEVLHFLIALVPFARSLTGEDVSRRAVPLGETPATFTAERIRPGMVDWMSRVMERFRSSASESFASSLERYQQLLPRFEGLSPRETLVALQNRKFVASVEQPIE